jgi:hypothetical protein
MADKNVNKMDFEKEIEILDKIYVDMVDAVHNKPNPNDIESMRLYLDNIYSVLNATGLRAKEVKNMLLADKKLIHETWNPPA